MLLAQVQPSSEAAEDEFNRWYDEVRIPQVISRIAEVQAAKRYRFALSNADSPRHHYSVVDDIEAADVETAASNSNDAINYGTLDMSESLNTSDIPPKLHFYYPLS